MKKYTITTSGLRKLTLEIFVRGGWYIGCVVNGDDLSGEHYVSSRKNIPIPSPALLKRLRPHTTDSSTRVSIADGDSTNDINLDVLMEELRLPTLKSAQELVKRPTLDDVAACVIVAKHSDFESALKATENVERIASGLASEDIELAVLATFFYTRHQLGISRRAIVYQAHARNFKERYRGA